MAGVVTIVLQQDIGNVECEVDGRYLSVGVGQVHGPSTERPDYYIMDGGG